MLTNTQQEATTYLKIVNGFFAVSTTPDNPQAKRRTTKTGREVYELHYDTLTGVIEDINYRKHQHDGITYRSITVKLSSGIGNYQLDLDVMSDAANTFFHCLPNIEDGKPITMNVWLGSDKTGTSRTKFIIKQHGSAVKWAYTNENPNGRPGWEKIVTRDVDGSEIVKWDRTAQIGWFINHLEEHAVRHRTHLRTTNPWEPAPEVPALNREQVVDEETGEVTDLPF